MTNNNEESRAAFEKWWMQKNGWESPPAFYAGEYGKKVQREWIVWNAALAHAETKQGVSDEWPSEDKLIEIAVRVRYPLYDGEKREHQHNASWAEIAKMKPVVRAIREEIIKHRATPQPPPVEPKQGQVGIDEDCICGEINARHCIIHNDYKQVCEFEARSNRHAQSCECQECCDDDERESETFLLANSPPGYITSLTIKLEANQALLRVAKEALELIESDEIWLNDNGISRRNCARLVLKQIGEV